MKKQLAIIFIPIILAFHFPVTPQTILPREWVAEFEDGKQWAQLFLSFYRSQTAESSPGKESPKAETDTIPQPLVFRPLFMAQALAPAFEEAQQMQIEHSLEKCEFSLRKIEMKIVEERALKVGLRIDHKRAFEALERLKDVRLPQTIISERLRVIHVRLPGRPA